MMRSHPEILLDLSETRLSVAGRPSAAPLKRERESEFLLDFSEIRRPATMLPSTAPVKFEREAEVPRCLVPRGSLLSLTGGLPSSEMPKEGRRTWGANVVTQENLDTTERLIVFGRPSSGPGLSLLRAFKKWCDVQLALPSAIGETIAIFGGYLFDAGLKASTCASYVRSVLFLERREPHVIPKFYIADDVLKGLDKTAASEPRNHAIDIDEDRAREIISAIQKLDVQWTIWVMAMCGARVADLLRLGPGQIVVQGSTLWIHFKVTKTVHEQDKQYSVQLPIWIPFRPEWEPFLSSPTPFTADCDRVDYVLHAAGFPETSYSFRRLFINQVIDRFTESGLTNWISVIEFTGHQQVKTVKGLYKRHRPLDLSLSK